MTAYAGARALFEQSLPLRRAVGDRSGEAATLLGLGIVALGQGDPATAQAHCAESLALSGSMGDRAGEADARRQLGNIAAGSGQPRRSAGPI